MENRMKDVFALGARLLIAQLFVLGAVQKGVAPGPTVDLLVGLGWPAVLIWPALLFNAGVGVCLILGRAVRPVATAAAAYCAVTSVFHFIPADDWQMTIFVKNWAIAGGCLALAALGSGRFALQPTPGPLGSGETGKRRVT